MSAHAELLRLPVIDLSLFDVGGTWRDHVAAQVDWAASEFGFFYVIGHGIESTVIEAMLGASRLFFSQPGATRALYFREEIAEDDERVGSPVHQRNVFPDVPGFRDAVLDYMSALSGLGHRLMASIGRALRLGDTYFVDRYTGRPATLFRVMRQPEAIPEQARRADGFLSLQYQDELSALQVKHGVRWLDAPFVPGSFVIGVGDVLERLTAGRYISTPHRSIGIPSPSPVALPFSFGPRVDAVLRRIPGVGEEHVFGAPLELTGGRPEVQSAR